MTQTRTSERRSQWDNDGGSSSFDNGSDDSSPAETKNRFTTSADKAAGSSNRSLRKEDNGRGKGSRSVSSSRPRSRSSRRRRNSKERTRSRSRSTSRRRRSGKSSRREISAEESSQDDDTSIESGQKYQSVKQQARSQGGTARSLRQASKRNQSSNRGDESVSTRGTLETREEGTFLDRLLGLDQKEEDDGTSFEDTATLETDTSLTVNTVEEGGLFGWLFKGESAGKEKRENAPSQKKSENQGLSRSTARSSPRGVNEFEDSHVARSEAVGTKENYKTSDEGSKETSRDSHSGEDVKKDNVDSTAERSGEDPWAAGPDHTNSFPPNVSSPKKSGTKSIFKTKSKSKYNYMKMAESSEEKEADSSEKALDSFLAKTKSMTKENEAPKKVATSQKEKSATGKTPTLGQIMDEHRSIAKNRSSYSLYSEASRTMYSSDSGSYSDESDDSGTRTNHLGEDEGTVYTRFSEGMKKFWGGRDSEPSSQGTSSAVLYNQYGDASDVVHYSAVRPIPYPLTPDEVVIKVEASSVSRTDCLIRRNRWHETVKLPATPGCDCVGRVFRRHVEADEDGPRDDDRVAIIDPSLGGNARYLKTPVSRLIGIPDDIDAALVVAILQSFLPAYQCLHRVGGLTVEKGHNVLITDAHTPFGQAAIQLSSLYGATAYAIADARFKDVVEAQGGIFIEGDPRQWLCSVSDSMDIVLFTKGPDYFELAHDTLKDGGKIICVGGYEDWWTESVGSNLVSYWSTGLANQVFTYDLVMMAKKNLDVVASDLEFVFEMAATGMISPLPFKRIALSSVATAQQEMEELPHDKVVVCMPWRKAVRNNSFGKGNLGGKKLPTTME